MAARDVVVVGSGHNALVAACYLARAGLDVEVVERDTVLGGACRTVERWPGYAVDRGLERAHHGPAHRHRRGPAAGRVRPHLPRHGPVGLRAVRRPGPASSRRSPSTSTSTRPAPRSRRCAATATPTPTAPSSPTGPPATRRCSRPSRTCPPPAGSAGTCGAPARRAASAGWRCRGSSCSRPTSCSTSTSATSGSRRRCPGWARSPARRRTRSPPPTWSAGTRCCTAGPPGRAVGGSGALTVALAERLRRLGGSVRLGDGAAAITRDGDRVTGVAHRRPASTSRPARSSPAATC